MPTTWLSSAPPLPEEPSLAIGHGWEMVGGRCHPVRHTRAALQGEESEEDDEEEGDHDVERRGDSSESDDSEAEFSDDMF